jgi:hypothetical protein
MDSGIRGYRDSGNGIFALTTLLGSASFGAVGSNTDIAVVDSAALYSVTGVYKISALSLGGAGSSLAMSAVSAIPEPASYVLFGLAACRT